MGAAKKMYGSMYSKINMNTMPGEMKLPGKTVEQQALSVDYQDIPRDIQVMRQDEYNQEVKEGEFVPEFSGLRMPKRRGLAGYFGDAAQKTAPGLLLAGALFALYWMFFRKDGTEMVEEVVEMPATNPEEDGDDFDLDDDTLLD